MNLLDTNTCITYLRGTNIYLARRILSRPPTQIRLCSVVLAEQYYGVYRGTKAAAELKKVKNFTRRFRSLSFNRRAAKTMGRIRAELAAQGTPIGPYDLQIAAIALTHGATLVTHNTSEFRRVRGLTIEDWELP